MDVRRRFISEKQYRHVIFNFSPAVVALCEASTAFCYSDICNVYSTSTCISAAFPCSSSSRRTDPPSKSTCL